MAMKIRMIAPYADPHMVLLEGKTYRVSDALGKLLCTPGSGKTEVEAAARVDTTNARPLIPPTRPDPQDTADELNVDEDEDESL